MTATGKGPPAFYSKELQRLDRELFLELIETPIQPAFFHMSTPFVDGYNPMFDLQISGEGLWQLRGYVSRNTDILLAVLQDNLSQIGYQLTQSSSFSSWKHCEEQ